ncbi:MAG: S-layer homology domain-containing protein [Clostridia bacterium]|nr:S-layer homology domain-containing protein [Clostridia bacterium]
MKNVFKKALAVLLTLVIVSGSFVCFAAELNQDSVNLHHGQYENYVLLGDSVASGYRDQITDNDREFNRAHQETTYYRVPGSYADVLANAIVEDKSMTAFAAPGFRTIEIRYMLEDDFDGADEYLFHPAQLDAVGFAGSEEFRTAYKQAIADADLITLGVGGNDWGAYLTWVVADVLEKENVADEYVKMLQDFLADNELDLGDIEDLVEIAHLAGALPELLETIPSALEYGLSNFYNNWDIMIQDIYDLNPDVTLMVVGMSDNGNKGKYYDYNGVEGELVNGEDASDAEADALTSTIIDFIMSVGNGPMIKGAEKFGYTYVDTDGTTYVDSHPDADGHVFIANKIIEALPDPDISKKYDDVKPGHKYYNDIEYVLLNGIMSATSATTFSPDDALTNGQLAQAMNVINGTDDATDDTEEASVIKVASAFLNNGFSKGFPGVLKAISLAINVLVDSGFDFSASVSRANAANYFKTFAEI